MLAEWALSDDEALRFDALALIDDFKVVIPALQALAARLPFEKRPGASFEFTGVERILQRLASQPHRGHN